MAPEAITATDRVDARTDLYAVGAVSYFLIAGKAIFEGPERRRRLRAAFAHRAGAAVDVSARPCQPISALILRCLRKHRRTVRRRRARAPPRASRLHRHRAWSLDDAARWWQLFRKERRVGPAATASSTMARR
jgi:hypothetical protein